MRISIIGSSGSGKTALARRVATRLRCDHIEIDGVFHQPGWEPLDPDTFRSEMRQRLAAPAWVCDGNYQGRLDSMVQVAADTIVWFDLSRATVMRQLIRRTLRRVVTREELWNGNREPLSNLYRWDPEVNVIRWSWVHHDANRDAFERLIGDGSWAHATVVRLPSHAAAEVWLESLPIGTDAAPDE